MIQKFIEILYKFMPNTALRIWYWLNIRRIEKEYRLLEQTRTERMVSAETKLNSLIDDAYERERLEPTDNERDSK